MCKKCDEMYDALASVEGEMTDVTNDYVERFIKALVAKGLSDGQAIKGVSLALSTVAGTLSAQGIMEDMIEEGTEELSSAVVNELLTQISGNHSDYFMNGLEGHLKDNGMVVLDKQPPPPPKSKKDDGGGETYH